jgi:tetratricopeptide (TPR) repeat protein
MARALNNLGVLEMINNNMDESRNALISAIDIARTGGMLESWGMAEINLGVLAGRLGDYPTASRAFSEALRLAASAQNGEYQLLATLNLAHLERDHDRFRAATDSYGVVIGLAERMGQTSVQASAEAGYGLCRRQLGDLESAHAALGRSLALTETIDEWYQGRELVVTLRLHFMLAEGRIQEAIDLLSESLRLCDTVEVAGSAALVAEFGEQLLPHAPELIRSAVDRYAGLPELVFNARIKARFEALKGDARHNSR